jgi:hypothetical protein
MKDFQLVKNRVSLKSGIEAVKVNLNTEANYIEKYKTIICLQKFKSLKMRLVNNISITPPT